MSNWLFGQYSKLCLLLDKIITLKIKDMALCIIVSLIYPSSKEKVSQQGFELPTTPSGLITFPLSSNSLGHLRQHNTHIQIHTLL